MTEPGPARLVEFQCEREYEFIGMVPNWMGPEWSQGPIECGEFGRTGLANSRPLDWAGSWIIPIGGGWSNRHVKHSLWADMNVHAALALTIDPERDSSDILSEWISENSLPKELKSLLERREMLDAFNPRSLKWRKMILERSQAIIVDAITHLSEE